MKKNKLRVLAVCGVLMACSLCACSTNNASADSQKSTSSVSYDEVTTNQNNITDMKKKTDESLKIYVDLIGTETEDGNINVSDEFLDNVNNVYIMGRTGTVNHGMAETSDTQIRIMEWSDNEKTTETEFEEFISLLNDYWGETGQIKSYENYSEETHVWKDYDNTSYVLCWYVDGTIKMSWHFDEGITKAENTGFIKDNNNKVTFTNEYGTPTTKCAHSGCNNYIASSGDTNCCTQHSNRCLGCNKYIDEDALYCVACIENTANEIKSETHTCEECGKEGTYTITGITGQTEYYCYTHYKELQDMYESLFGND